MIEEFLSGGQRLFIDLTAVECVVEQVGWLQVSTGNSFCLRLDGIALDDFVRRWKIAKAQP